MNTEKMTERQTALYELLKENFDGKDIFAEDVAEMPNTHSVASIRATLSSLEKRGLLSKEKAPRGEKMLTKYTLVKAE